MNFLGFTIKKQDPHEHFGKVLFNIQVRERGISLAGPDGIDEIDPKTINPRAHLLGYVYLERFIDDWSRISKLQDPEVEVWIQTLNSYKNNNDPQPACHAMVEIMKARETYTKDERDRDVI